MLFRKANFSINYIFYYPVWISFTFAWVCTKWSWDSYYFLSLWHLFPFGQISYVSIPISRLSDLMMDATGSFDEFPGREPFRSLFTKSWKKILFEFAHYFINADLTRNCRHWLYSRTSCHPLWMTLQELQCNWRSVYTVFK